METTEKIVESYCRYIQGWFTIPNIKCKGQYEIDLLAIEPVSSRTLNRYHIESGVSISGSYSKLTDKNFDPEKMKQRVEEAGQRRTMGYFIERKFGGVEIVEKLKEYGFEKDNYKRVIVSWGWTKEAEQKAQQTGIILWDFREILDEIATQSRETTAYFTDDTLRTIQLFIRSGISG